MTDTKAPERIWIEQQSDGHLRSHWRFEPNNRRFGLEHTNVEYIRADLVDSPAPLSQSGAREQWIKCAKCGRERAASTVIGDSFLCRFCFGTVAAQPTLAATEVPVGECICHMGSVCAMPACGLYHHAGCSVHVDSCQRARNLISRE
jgi:hypothetical protein